MLQKRQKAGGSCWPYISLSDWSWGSHFCSGCRRERAMGLRRARPHRWPRLEQTHTHTHTSHMIDGPPLTAALDEASARWLMVALAHRSSSFHDLKTFALMHPHKRELWWAPRNSQIWALTLFPVYRRDAVQKPGCVFAILIFSVRPQVLCFGALQ